jgi:hypothetical protein
VPERLPGPFSSSSSVTSEITIEIVSCDHGGDQTTRMPDELDILAAGKHRRIDVDSRTHGSAIRSVAKDGHGTDHPISGCRIGRHESFSSLLPATSCRL